jgi:NADH:ubiquinone oxidoreductase subunit 5 (subunit L)/multisubunit Na+/H+ antiporter MnhA subunit
METTQIAHAVLGAIPSVAPLMAAAWLGASSTVGYRPSERATVTVTMTALLASLVSSLVLVAMVMSSGTIDLDYWHWFDAGSYHVNLGVFINGPAAAMLTLTALFIGVISRFSRNYLHRDPGFVRFFATMNLAAAAMSILVTAGSLELVFVGWELLGVSSALLVGYFQDRASPVRNALRVFAVYRIADVGLLAAGVLLHSIHVSTEFSTWDLNSVAHNPAMGTAIALCLLFAAAGKSAQLPFSSWLPRAMEGPTPSSAMFYGALSIHAGAFLLLRAEPLIASSTIAQVTVIAVGSLTAIHANMVYRAQTDVKSRLAYATLGHVGVIFTLIGLGWTTAAAIWMVAHALLRGGQLLRSPSALTDAELEFNLTRKRSTMPLWLYRAALERFYLDTFIDRFVVGGFRGLTGLVDGFDRIVTGRPHDFASRPSPADVTKAGRDLAQTPTTWRVGGIVGLFLTAIVGWSGVLHWMGGHEPPVATMLMTMAMGAASCVPFARTRTAAYRWVGGATAAMSVVGLIAGLSLMLDGTPLNENLQVLGLVFRFHVDVLSIGAILLMLLVTFATALAGPRTRATRRDLALVQLLIASSVGVFASDQLAAFVVFSAISFCCAIGLSLRHGTAAEDKWWKRGLVGSVAVSYGALVVALFMIPSAEWWAPMDTVAAHLTGWPLALLALSGWTRAGLFPFHGWMLGMPQKLPVVASAPWLLAPVGVYTFARLGLAGAAHGGATIVLLVLIAAAAQGVYGVILAFAQKNLRTMIGALALADTGLAMLAIVEADQHTLHGGLLMVLANGVALTGLLVVAAATASRAGSDVLLQLRGFARRAPMLSTWFIVFAVAGFGLPGSPAFIASELVLHGTWQAHPGFAVLFAVTQGLASVALWRVWTIAYLGQPVQMKHANALSAVAVSRPLDATRRERTGALALAGVGLVLGIMPALALNFEAPAVDHLLRQVDPVIELHAPDEASQHAPAVEPHTLLEPEAADTASSVEGLAAELPLK